MNDKGIKLEDRLGEKLRRKHYSLKTEETYVGWYRRYVIWHGKRHPETLGAAEIGEEMRVWMGCSTRLFLPFRGR